MTNIPYEDELDTNTLDETGLQEVTENFSKELETLVSNNTQEETPQQSEAIEGAVSGVADEDFLKQKQQDYNSWNDLPEGLPKDLAKDAFYQKYYGDTEANWLKKTGIDMFQRAPAGGAGAIGGLAAGAGLLDTGIDAINLIPKVNVPKLPEFESKTLQGFRNFFGLILPMMATKGAIAGKAKGIHQAGTAPKSLQKLGNDRLFRWFSEAGLDIGVGVGVDLIAEQNKKNDNFTGYLKQEFPRQFKWIPDSIATNSNKDSPDQMLVKNAREGALGSFLVSTAEGLSLILKSGIGLKQARKFIPENELAKNNLPKLTTDKYADVKLDDNPITNEFLISRLREEDALKEINEYHDLLFDVNEVSIRPKDTGGITAASVDAAQIQKNIDTSYGRLASTIDEKSRQIGLDPDNLSNRTVVKKLASDLKQSGKYSVNLASGKTITNQNIEEAGERLAEILNNPRMQPGEMKLLLDEFKTSVNKGLGKLNRQGVKAIDKSILKLKEELFNMDYEKARAYFLTSESGQIADIAKSSRYVENTTNAVSRAQDQILDRLEYLMVEKRLATYQNGLRPQHLKAWDNAAQSNDVTLMKKTANAIVQDTENKLESIIPQVKKYRDTLQEIKDSNPEFLKPLMLANELTDGNIDTLYKLQVFTENKLGTLSKAFYDGKPEIPSIINRAQVSIIFNSLLSSFATPIKALAGNIGGLIGKPAGTFVGALGRGDWYVIRRGFHQYAGFTDSFVKGFEHMKLVYKKAAENPTKVSYIMRDDIALKEVKELDALYSYAEALNQNGNSAAKVLLSIYEEQDKLASHPWLRFGANSMTALDGFSRSMNASAKAKGLAFDDILRSGEDFTEESLQKASDEIYKTFFDADDMITDEAVDFATREMALNLSSPLVDGLNTVIKKFPILRSVFWFPKTQANSLHLFAKWSPMDLALKPFRIFEGDYQKFTKHSFRDYPEEELKELLGSKGIPWDEHAEAEFNSLRAEYQGRVAIGTTTMIGASVLALQGDIRGNGHWDQQVQRSRRGVNWKPKTIRNPLDGKWYSYESLGPIGDLVAASADLIDNFDSMSTTTMEEMFFKLSFILGASFTDKSLLSDMEPVTAMLNGNVSAMNNYAAQIANSWHPGAGIRRDLTNILSPMKREYDNDVLSIMRNRNNFLDVIDPSGSLPYKYNFVTGKQIGRPENMWVRFNNAFNPIKVHDSTTEEEQFLLDIEYDSTPYFNLSRGGVEYSAEQRAALFSKIGEHGQFNKQLKSIIKDAKRLKYTDNNGITYKGYIDIVKAIRTGGISSDIFDSKVFAKIFTRIDLALNQAKRLAEYDLQDDQLFSEIELREIYLRSLRQQLEQGNANEAMGEFNQLQQQLQSR